MTRIDSLMPDRDQRGEHRDEQERQQVERAPRSADRGGPRVMPMLLEEEVGVLRPALRDHAGAEQQLEEQVPADDPGDQLTEGGVGERVRRPGDRDGRGELRVAEGGEAAADRGETNENTIAGPA